MSSSRRAPRRRCARPRACRSSRWTSWATTTSPAVTVNGAPATFARDVDAGAYKYKLVVTPAAGIANSSTFEVVVDYSGTPQNFLDPDNSCEGFMRTTASLGSFTMNEPVGAMGWFPNNNHPARQGDLRLPPDGAGRLRRDRQRRAGLEGRQRRRHDDLELEPRLSDGELPLDIDDRSLRRFHVHGRDRGRGERAAVEALRLHRERAAGDRDGHRQQGEQQHAARSPGRDRQVHRRHDRRAYPFDSHGVVAGRAPSVPGVASGVYALEVQTKSHFGSGGIGIGTLAHEIAHQWFGDSVGPASWREIWFNEGWATWWATWWQNKRNDSPISDGAAPSPRTTTRRSTRAGGTPRPMRSPARASCSTRSRSTRVRRWRSRATARSSATRRSSPSRRRS